MRLYNLLTRPQRHETELVFPSNKNIEKKYKVSREAMDLIDNVLQEKEKRLSSKKYMLNDYEQLSRMRNQNTPSLANAYAQDYQGTFVFPDDATDIKAHPFFQGIAWDTLHTSRPPWVPIVRGKDDTTYFEEDEPISDVDDASSFSSEQELLEQEAFENAVAMEYRRRIDDPELDKDTDQVQLVKDIVMEESAKLEFTEAARGFNFIGKKELKPREKKRPRDRILRDKQVGRQVLEIRKRGAFLGYTYRRLSAVVNDENEVDSSGKQSTSKRARFPSIV